MDLQSLSAEFPKLVRRVIVLEELLKQERAQTGTEDVMKAVRDVTDSIAALGAQVIKITEDIREIQAAVDGLTAANAAKTKAK